MGEILISHLSSNIIMVTCTLENENLRPPGKKYLHGYSAIVVRDFSDSKILIANISI